MSFTRSPPNVLVLSQDAVQNMDGGAALAGLWFLFTKCKASVADGGRLENVSWRLWYREHANARLQALSSPLPAMSSNKKSPAGKVRAHVRPLTPDSPNGVPSDVDEKQEVVTEQKLRRKIGQVIWDVSTSPPLASSISNPIFAVLPPADEKKDVQDGQSSSLPTPETEKEQQLTPLAIEVSPPLPVIAVDPTSPTTSAPPSAMPSRSTTAPSSRTSTAPPSRSTTAPSTPRSGSRANSPPNGLYPRLVIVNPTPHPTPPATPIHMMTTGQGHTDGSSHSNTLKPPPLFTLTEQPTPQANDTAVKGRFFVPDEKDQGSGSSSSGSGSSAGSSMPSQASAPTTIAAAVLGAPVVLTERSAGKQPAVEPKPEVVESAVVSSDEDEDETQVEDEEPEEHEEHKRIMDRKHRSRLLGQRSNRSKSRGKEMAGSRRFGGRPAIPHRASGTKKEAGGARFQVGSGESNGQGSQDSRSPTVPTASTSRPLPPALKTKSTSEPLAPQTSKAGAQDNAAHGHATTSMPPPPTPTQPSQHSSAAPTRQQQPSAVRHQPPGILRSNSETSRPLSRNNSSKNGLSALNMRMTQAKPAPSNLRLTANNNNNNNSRTEPPTRNVSHAVLPQTRGSTTALPSTTTADGLAAATALVQKHQEQGGNRGRVELTSDEESSTEEEDEEDGEDEDDEGWTSATGSEGEDENKGEPQTAVQRPAPPPLMRRQTTMTHNLPRMQRARSAAPGMMAEEKARQEAIKAQKEKELFTKMPKRSWSGLNRTGSGLLTQLMNPDPNMFEENHPYRRGHSTGTVALSSMGPPAAPPGGLALQAREAMVKKDLPPAPAPAPVARPPPPRQAPAPQRPSHSRAPSTASTRGFLMPSLTSKVNLAGPVEAQVHAGSVSRPTNTNVRQHTRDVSGGYRPKGKPEALEMESSDEEDETPQAVGNVSQSVAHQRLQALADRKGAAANKGKAKATPAREQDQLPPWVINEVPDFMAHSPSEMSSSPAKSSAISMGKSHAPLNFPYNREIEGMPTSPRTTKANMLRDEISQSVHNGLVSQRQTSISNLAPQRRSTANLRNLQNRDIHKSVVEVRPKKVDDKQRQSVESERRELEAFVTGKKSALTLGSEEAHGSAGWGTSRPSIARHKSWAYDPR